MPCCLSVVTVISWAIELLFWKYIYIQQFFLFFFSSICKVSGLGLWPLVYLDWVLHPPFVINLILLSSTKQQFAFSLEFARTLCKEYNIYWPLMPVFPLNRLFSVDLCCIINKYLCVFQIDNLSLYYSTLKFIQSLVILNFGFINDGPVNVCLQFFFCSWNKCTRISSFSCSLVLFCWFVSSVLEIGSLHMLTSILSLIASHPVIFSLEILFPFYYAEDWVLYMSSVHSTTELHPCSKSNIFWFFHVTSNVAKNAEPLQVFQCEAACVSGVFSYPNSWVCIASLL